MTEKKDFEQIVEELRAKYKCTVEILIDSEQNLQGIFLQDDRMKTVFEAFPEVNISNNFIIN